MIRQFFFVFVLTTLLPATVALADSDDLTVLWSDMDERTDARSETDAPAVNLGFLEPLLETFLDDYDPAAPSDEFAPLDLDLEYDLWVAEYAEDCGPKEDWGSKFVLEYSFDF